MVESDRAHRLSDAFLAQSQEAKKEYMGTQLYCGEIYFRYVVNFTRRGVKGCVLLIVG
jgi:hypothetical protein